MLTARDKVCLAGLIVLVLWPVAACGQARSRYHWKSPSLDGISTVGGSDFVNYSSGVGGLRQSSPTGTTGVLRSSIAGAGSYDLRRGAAGATALGTALPKLAGLKGRTYGDARKITLHAATGESALANISRIGSTAALAGVQSYLSSLSGRTTATQPNGEAAEPVTSFVPTEPGYYQKHMLKGDRAFRAERYLEAAGSFKVAAGIGRYAPESHLSLLHAYSALEHYHSAAHRLRKTLKYFPELPLAPLHVRGFYGRVETFVGHLEKLREAAEKPSADADLPLLLAYFLYFDGSEADAAKALRQAFAASKDRATTEAIYTFWRGMVAAGKVSGSLEPTTKPAGKQEPLPSPARTGSAAGPAAGERADNEGGKPSPSRKRDDK